jgi:RNA recognition motif-containing protein
LPFSTQWQDLKDLLRPAGRILRADIALAPDGRSKGWGTAVFATPQEAQHAIDTFDGWEVDGRIIKVRWDKFQGSSPTTESASQPPAPAGISASPPTMMQAQMSPTQTPRPGEYVALMPNPQTGVWGSQYPTGQMRPLPPQTTIAGPSGMQTSPVMQMATAQSPYGQPFLQSTYMSGLTAGSSSSQNPSVPQGQYPVGMVYNPPPAGWFPTTYGGPSVQQPPLPQVRLPSATNVDPSQISFAQMNQPQNVQRTDQQAHDLYPYGSSMYTSQ